MRQARAVARRARVVGRRRDLVLGATLGRARVRLLLLGDGHERPRRVEHRRRAGCFTASHARRRTSARCATRTWSTPTACASRCSTRPSPARTRPCGRPASTRASAICSTPIPAAAGWPSTTAASPGVGLALIREGVWGFSLFGVAEALQGRGVGRELFARCWEYGAGARGHLILSSTNPQAMGIYAHTGLPIRPCVAAAGIPDLVARARRGRRRRRGRGGHRGGRRHRPRAARRGPRARPARADGPWRAAARLRGPRLRPRAREQRHPARRPRRAGRPAHAVGACSSAARRAPP